MAVNPFTRRPKQRPVFSRDFTDEDWSFTLTFKRPGVLENCAAHDRGVELKARYLGDEEKETRGIDFVLADGTIVPLSPTAIANACVYESMQASSATERYRAEDFIAFQATLSDECWNAVSAFAAEVRRGGEIPPTSGGATETSSESASGTQGLTPSS